MNPGDLYERVAFDSPTATDDAYGGTENGWTEEFSTRAHFLYLRGSEAVQSARLEGRQPIIATIRRNTATERITPDWRMRDTRTGTIYQIRTKEPTQNRAYFELMCESGVAV